MHSGNILEHVSEAVLELTEAAKGTGNVLEVSNKELRAFLRIVYEIFHHELLEVKPEENDAMVIDLLRQYLEQSGNSFIYEFVPTYSKDKSTNQVIVAIFLLLLVERKLSDLFLHLLSNKSIKTFYKPTASLLNVEFMFNLIKRLQNLESKKIVIKAKWIDKYTENKPAEKAKTKETMLELFNQTPMDFQYPQASSLYKSLNDNDPIKQWMSGKSSFNLESLEKKLKSDIEFGHAELGATRFSAKQNVPRDSSNVDRATLIFPNKNKLYRALMKINQSDKKKEISLEESRETVVQEDEVNSGIIHQKFVEPFIGHFNDMITKAEKRTPQTAPRDQCPSCSTPLKFGFFGVD
jgi:hypothetical protein